MSDNQIFIGNLHFEVTWQDLKDLFSECGTVVRADIPTGPNKRSKGYGTVLFSKHEEALFAIEEFNGATLEGRVIEVRFDKGPTERPNKDKRAKPFAAANHSATSPSGGSGGGKVLYVGNLSWGVQWDELRQLLQEAGHVASGDIMMDYQGRSKGFGIVNMGSPEAAKAVIEKFNGYELDGRNMEVRYDKGSTPKPEFKAEPKAKVEGERLLILNLPATTQWQQVKDMFKDFGAVLRADVQLNEDESSAIGFVTLEKNSVAKAISHWNGNTFQDRQIIVDYDNGTIKPSSSSGASVYIGNLPFQVRWQDLKDLFKDGYTPIRADVMMDGPTRSKGFGIVKFATLEEAESVVRDFQGTTLQGRPLVVRLDKFTPH